MDDQAEAGSASDAEILAEALKILGNAVDESVLIARPSGELSHANARARRLLGWDAAQEPPARWIESMPLGPSVRRRLEEDRGAWVEDTVVTVRGAAVPVNLARHPIAVGGRTAGALVVITETTDVENAIRDRDRARRDDRAKTRSLHMVAHDMGGPLTILNGYVSLVREGSLTVEQLEPYLPMLAEQLEHMQRLVDVLLDTARVEEGRLELRLQALDLADFVESLVRRLRPPETRHRLVIRREAAAVPVLADPARLDSILRNILSNAVKYSPEGTSVTCTVRLDDGAAVEVVDEGSGIEARDLERLFTRFSRVGDQEKNPAGVGLGLFLSRELARLHGGDLEAASEAGKGSRFTLRLPLRGSENG